MCRVCEGSHFGDHVRETCILLVVNQVLVCITAVTCRPLVTPREEKLCNYAGEGREGWGGNLDIRSLLCVENVLCVCSL